MKYFPRPAVFSGRRRVLVLTAAYGEGHNAAARALVTAFERLGPGTANLVDVFAQASPRMDRFARWFYLTLINRAPQCWSGIYQWVDRTRAIEQSLSFFASERRALWDWLERERPTAVCCTFPLYAFLLDDIVRRGGPRIPRFNVVTDSISINSLWWRIPSDGWFLPNEDSSRVMFAAGLPVHRIHTTGFPVAAAFAEEGARMAPPDLEQGATPRVLYVLNSGVRHAIPTLKRLFDETEWEITCAVGRDESLRAQIEKLAASRRARTTVLGWTKDMPKLLLTHHVVISKAGGATTQEAIAARCPMIVSQVVPGQEEGNYELLRRRDIGARAETPAAVIDSLRRAFADDGKIWHEWRAALAPLARPNAALDIAQRVLAAGSAETAHAFVIPGRPISPPLGAAAAVEP